MKKKVCCCECQRELVKDEIALNKKMIDQDVEEFYCLPCMAEYFGCYEQDLREKIQEFKEQGCTLFL